MTYTVSGGTLNPTQLNSHFLHSYLLSDDEQTICRPSGLPLTVTQIPVECLDFQDIREKYFYVSSLKDLLESVDDKQNLACHQFC